MNSDPSNNIIHRRVNGGGGGDPERNSASYRERFELNQYYNAVEDEQIYMDEYTTLSHRYNEFMMNANAMYIRMEQTLRESLTRTMVRQSFYYQRVRENVGGGGGGDVGVGVGIQQPIAVPVTPQELPPAPTVTASTGGRLGDVFPRLLSRYFTSEVNREAREPNTEGGVRQGSGEIAMLYTVPISRGVGGGGDGAGAGSSVPRPGAPTNDQINRATLNTTFSNIVSPINATCPISRDEFNDNSEITMIRGCNHIFNRTSLREWFVHQSSCPMCRRDIRMYRPSAASSSASSLDHTRETQVPTTNISIDRVDNDSITFSYDLPVEYNNEQIYQDIVNRITGRMPQTSQPNPHDHGDHGDQGDHGDHGDYDDDIMEVD
jgi:hypothetical protein